MNLTLQEDQKTPFIYDKKQRILSKVERYGYSTQFDAIKSEGFDDEKSIFRALKKNKGDIPNSIEYLKNAPPKKDKKQKFYRDDKHERGSRRCHKNFNDFKQDGFNGINHKKSEQKYERYLSKKTQKNQRIVDENPQFQSLNDTLNLSGFKDTHKNYKALKKHSGDVQKASDHLKFKKILSNIEIRKTFTKGEFTKIYLDCNNCFYLEQSLLKKAVSREYKEIEEKIASIMKVFQSKYGSQVEIVLVYDNSKLIKDEKSYSKYADSTFKLISAKPQFQSADDALVHLASTESNENQYQTLYITSDRMLQARLYDKNAKNIIGSNTFFNILRKEFVGNSSYSYIMDA